MSKIDYIIPATSRLIRRKMIASDSSSSNRASSSTDKQRATERITECIKAVARSGKPQ